MLLYVYVLCRERLQAEVDTKVASIKDASERISIQANVRNLQCSGYQIVFLRL